MESAVCGQPFGVQQDERTLVNPSRLSHLASAVKTSMYSDMNSRPARSCSSSFGSYGVNSKPPGVSTRNSSSPFSTSRRASISSGSTIPSNYRSRSASASKQYPVASTELTTLEQFTPAMAPVRARPDRELSAPRRAPLRSPVRVPQPPPAISPGAANTRRRRRRPSRRARRRGWPSRSRSGTRRGCR